MAFILSGFKSYWTSAGWAEALSEETSAKNAQQPKDLLQDEWKNTEHSVLEKLVDSVLSRLWERINANGCPTRY